MQLRLLIRVHLRVCWRGLHTHLVPLSVTELVLGSVVAGLSPDSGPAPGLVRLELFSVVRTDVPLLLLLPLLLVLVPDFELLLLPVSTRSAASAENERGQTEDDDRDGLRKSRDHDDHLPVVGRIICITTFMLSLRK